MKKSRAVFKFKPFSKKQRKVLNWWIDNSPVKDKDGIIADGSIRSGKTVSMSLSYMIWAMSNFTECNFGMCGKTIGSFRRNVLNILKLMLWSRGYKLKDHRADNMVEISKNGITNYFYVFGGKDESSQDLIQPPFSHPFSLNFEEAQEPPDTVLFCHGSVLHNIL